MGIECKKAPDLVRRAPGLTPQKIIDSIHEEGGFAILAHPSWSLNRVDRVLQLRDIDATEIYNTFSGVPWNGRPYSGDFVDMMAAEGRYLPCMAADDSHRYEGEAGRSYVMVKAAELTRDGIMLVSGVILYLVYGVGGRDLSERLEAKEKRAKRLERIKTAAKGLGKRKTD